MASLKHRPAYPRRQRAHRFITDVLLPALFSRKRGHRNGHAPIFPKPKVLDQVESKNDHKMLQPKHEHHFQQRDSIHFVDFSPNLS